VKDVIGLLDHSLSETDARHSPLADSMLLMMNFGIDKMSLEIQSRGMYSSKTQFLYKCQSVLLLIDCFHILSLVKILVYAEVIL